jgi:hypothetical protein
LECSLLSLFEARAGTPSYLRLVSIVALAQVDFRVAGEGYGLDAMPGELTLRFDMTLRAVAR